VADHRCAGTALVLTIGLFVLFGGAAQADDNQSSELSNKLTEAARENRSRLNFEGNVFAGPALDQLLAAANLDTAAIGHGIDGLRDLYASPGGEPAFFGMREEAELLAAVRAAQPDAAYADAFTLIDLAALRPVIGSSIDKDGAGVARVVHGGGYSR
jgi:hypothetical protein